MHPHTRVPPLAVAALNRRGLDKRGTALKLLPRKDGTNSVEAGEMDDTCAYVIFGKSTSIKRVTVVVSTGYLPVIIMSITMGVKSGFSVIHGRSGNSILRATHA